MDAIDDSTGFHSEHRQDAASSRPIDSGPARLGFVERLLSPQALQRMMACGGALLVLGMVAWLWSIGLFANPVVVAILIGTASLSTIVAGVGLAKFTNHFLAGQGLALLGALALPLNLWFYDAQGLITLAHGGHLWVPAAGCCVIYAAIAWWLRDAKFAYAFVGGIVLTGMLFLADRSVDQFWSLMPQVTFLVSAGWVCALISRQFPVGDGDFSRQTFGRAFLRSGMTVMTVGLAILGGAQLSTIVHEFIPLGVLPRIATDQAHKVWALGILLATTAGLAFEHVTRRADGRYGAAALGMSLWSGVCALDVLHVHPTVSHLAIPVGGMITIINLVRLVRNRQAENSSSAFPDAVRRLADAAIPLSVVLALVGGIHFAGQFVAGADSVLFSPTGWTLVVQLAITAAALGTTAIALRGEQQQTETRRQIVSLLTFVGGGVITLATSTLCLQAGVTMALLFAAVVLAAPLAFAALACLVDGENDRQNLRIAAGTALAMVFPVLTAFSLEGVFAAVPTHWDLAAIALASAGVCFLNAASRRAAANSIAGFIAVSCAVWQAGAAMGFDTSYALALSPTLAGVMLAGVRRLSRRTIPEDVQNTLVILGNIAGWLLAMNRVLVGEETIGLLMMLVVQMVSTAVVGIAARATEWRLAFRAAFAALMLALILVVNGLSSMTVWNRLELCSLAAGTTLLGMGLVAWCRETDRRDAMATAGFSLGSLLTAVPLSIGLIVHRLDGTGFAGWGLFHEVGVIVFGLLLLGLGLLGRIRSTTVAGGGLMTVFVLSLVTLIRLPEVLQSVSVMMMTGGATFFGTAILLSIYRDRLLALPAKIRDGHGIFQVLKWR